MTKHFNERFKEKTLKQEISEYNKIRIKADHMTKKIEKYVKHKAIVEKRKVNAIITRQKKIDVDINEENKVLHQ